MHYYLGIDAGTTKIKAGLVDPQGELVALASCAVDIQHAQRGWSEIDMNDLWQRVCQVLNELVQQHPEKINKVAAVGVAGQGDGYWPIQQDGEPAGPAIIWNDTRAKSLTLKPKDAIEQICRENYVTPLFPGSMPMILLWQKASHPERVERIDKILHCKDWINFKLTGERVSDYSDVSIALMDVRKREFVDELLALMGLADDKAKFPKPYPSSAIIGQVIPEASCVTGMPTGIPVIAGSIDVAAVAAGMGVYQPGDACTIVGTTLCNEIIIRAEDLREPILSGGALCHIAEGNILRFMATSSGTSALDWVRREIFANESYDQIEERIQKIPVGSDHLFFHPYLYGERAPFNDPFANGGFFGITANHTRDHMARAAFEGVAFSMLDCYENLPGNYSRIVVGGGASRSNTLCKMIADCMGVTIVRPDCPELGILGLCNTMAYALGHLKDYSSLAIKKEQVFEPDLDKHAEYRKLYPIFRQLRDYMKPFWHS